ncbi:hypothetical protein LUZ60_017232 [Juncus effusus]|nr:hypothetical protein LUZ60_017232 [Juncus effusus]
MTKNLSFLILLCFSLCFMASCALPSSSRGKPRYMHFTQDATEFPLESEHDYIVVGGGTAGCSLAATLSGGSYKVLLLERGGAPPEFSSVATSSGFLQTLSTTNQDSPAEPFVSEEGVPNTRARVLGGGSAINAGFYSRAPEEFFITNRSLNWDLNKVNKSYEWIERAIVYRPVVQGWQAAVRDGLIEAGVGPFNGFTVKHLTGTKVGGSTFDPSGRRHSAADLLSFARKDKIRVALRSSVARILLNPAAQDGSGSGEQKVTAIGVEYLDRLGRRHHAMTRAGGEVILCAGALGSPQLLLLSGIGPPAYLASWGIPVILPNENVGQFLYDNPRNGISVLPPSPIDHSLIQVVGIPGGEESFLEAASYEVPFISPQGTSLLRSQSTSPLYITVATIMEKVPGPASFGSLRLASLDPRDSPVARFNYFTDPDGLDLNRCVSGLRRVGDVLQSRSMDSFKSVAETATFWGKGMREFRFVGPALPANLMDDEAMRRFCKENVATLWHYHGGSVAGKVVDKEFRVVGTKGLRVVDGSILDVSPGTNPQATIMMMGRYVGQRIIAKRRIARNKKRPAPPAPPDL